VAKTLRKEEQPNKELKYMHMIKKYIQNEDFPGSSTAMFTYTLLQKS
jgi:hypothetical protein